ncbi:hypothetical protein ACFQZZ_22685 [Nocardia sp. GCM10030253]|uniref:hypothetical protein n=1 Tax=Nocardia sp. GCM10030253 TaxID=3273404 RepID=UPI003624F896
MPHPATLAKLAPRIEQLPAPIPRVWAGRTRLHAMLGETINRIQQRQYYFRDTVARPGMQRLGVRRQHLDAARTQHTRIFDPIYDTARTAHWYV